MSQRSKTVSYKLLVDMEQQEIKKRLKHVEREIVRYEDERDELLKRQDELLTRQKALHKTIKLVPIQRK